MCALVADFVSKKRKFNVDDAYDVRTPADSARLYGQWADTYDAEFAAPEGYAVYLRVGVDCRMSGCVRMVLTI